MESQNDKDSCEALVYYVICYIMMFVLGLFLLGVDVEYYSKYTYMRQDGFILAVGSMLTMLLISFVKDTKTALNSTLDVKAYLRRLRYASVLILITSVSTFISFIAALVYLFRYAFGF